MLPKELGQVLIEIGREFSINVNERGTTGDQLDNRAAVEAVKKLDDYFKNHVENILARINEQ